MAGAECPELARSALMGQRPEQEQPPLRGRQVSQQGADWVGWGRPWTG